MNEMQHWGKLMNALKHLEKPMNWNSAVSKADE
jgi:hypothetical protein